MRLISILVLVSNDNNNNSDSDSDSGRSNGDGDGDGGWWSDFLRLQIWYRWIKLDGRGEDGIMW